MFRSLAAIVFCLQVAQPHMADKQAETYAKIIQKTAKQNNFDPIIAIAIIQNESTWNPAAISPDGEDYGLSQIRARFRPGCLKDKNPVSDPSPECKIEKQKLLNGSYSIRAMGNHIGTWQKFCVKMTGVEPTYEQWMSGYGGFTRPKEKIWCNLQETEEGWVELPAPKIVRNIKSYKNMLLLSWYLSDLSFSEYLLDRF